MHYLIFTSPIKNKLGVIFGPLCYYVCSHGKHSTILPFVHSKVLTARLENYILQPTNLHAQLVLIIFERYAYIWQALNTKKNKLYTHTGKFWNNDFQRKNILSWDLSHREFFRDYLRSIALGHVTNCYSRPTLMRRNEIW